MNSILLIYGGCLLKSSRRIVYSPYEFSLEDFFLFIQFELTLCISVLALCSILFYMLSKRKEKYQFAFKQKELGEIHYHTSYNQQYLNEASFWQKIKNTTIGNWVIYTLIILFIIISYSRIAILLLN